MKIKTLQLKNFKSIKNIELVNPNPFSVFIGPNGAGKSNIFEALEVVNLLSSVVSVSVFDFYESLSDVLHPKPDNFSFQVDLGDIRPTMVINDYDFENNRVAGIAFDQFLDNSMLFAPLSNIKLYNETISYKHFFKGFSRLFLNHSEIKKQIRNDNQRLASDASNLEKVLERLLSNPKTKEEIVEWLQVLIPEFKDIQIDASPLDGKVNFIIYEKSSNRPFPKRLISDGSKNILALLAAVYQSDEPQFLCIEQPEDGLHPQVIESLVTLFRNACHEKGHYIWVNTHSQTLVRQLTVDEIIVVDKKDGNTQVKQFQSKNMQGLQMDEAWLTNALGGGLI